jgi:hypothetical protein
MTVFFKPTAPALLFLSLERTPFRSVVVAKAETWGQEKASTMRRSFLVTALSLGVALSGSAFGQSWTRSTATNPQSQANTYSPNTYDQQKARAQARQNNATSQPNTDKSPFSTSAKMTGQPNSVNSPSKPASSAKMSALPNSGSSSNSVNHVEMSGGPHGD